MATRINLTPNKTYASAARAEKAVASVPHIAANKGLRYLVVTTPEGRFFPVFLGNSALQAGVHFHFCVAN